MRVRSITPVPLRLDLAARRSPSPRRGSFAVLVRQTGSLWLLQLIAGVFAHIAFDIRPLALAVTMAYLLLALLSARELAREAAPAVGRRALLALGVALLWQLPALLGSVNLAREELGLTLYDGNSDLLDFAMQTWQTALMPVLALFRGELTGQTYRWYAAYYTALAASAPAVLLGYVLAALWPVE